MNKMTLKQIYDKFSTLKTSSDKLIYLEELKTLTLMKVINFDFNFKNIEESIMNER
tara:strand:+ start:231 stop:398 length:168 start_codon:yes stop_codon:yes gene_type:complete